MHAMHILIDTTQEIIDVQPHSETSTVTKILCKSSLALRNSTCRVMYGPAIRDNCTFNKNASANFEDGAAMIEVSTPQVDVTYCFVVTETSSGSAIAIIEGTFFSKSTPGMLYYATNNYWFTTIILLLLLILLLGSSIGVIVASVICIVGAGGLVAVVVTVFVVIFCCCRKKLIKVCMYLSDRFAVPQGHNILLLQWFCMLQLYYFFNNVILLYTKMQCIRTVL